MAALFAAVFASLTGCMTMTVEHRIAHYQDYFDSLPSEKQQKILHGEIEIGFSRRDVYLARGEPTNKFRRITEGDTFEIWSYRTYEYEPYYDHWDHWPYYGHYHHYPLHSHYRSRSYEYLRVVYKGEKVVTIEHDE